MSGALHFAQRLQARLKAHPLVALMALLVSVLVAAGAVAGSLSSIHSFWITLIAPQEDPRIFHFHGQLVRLTGGNGSSREQAIVITDALTTDAGVASEQHWVETFYPDYTLLGQALIKPSDGNPHFYDVLTIRSSTGMERALYFDVTGFFSTPLSERESQKALEQWMLIQARKPKAK